MIRRFIFLFGLICLTACSAPRSHKFPTSERLDTVKQQHLARVEEEVKFQHLTPGAPVYIRIFKEEREMELWIRGDERMADGSLKNGKTYHLYRSYPICTYSGALGPKIKEGDEQAPEGFYGVTADKLNPSSQYHLAMNIGYPNAFDKAQGLSGSYLMIHGGCKSVGCFAMTDSAIEEIYMLAELSLRTSANFVPIHIFPFRMTPENMERHAASKWMPFWKHIKPGYDVFEKKRIPPYVVMDGPRYRVAHSY